MAAQGQTIADRLNAARHSIAGQGLAKAVCKATTEEVLAPKKKHLDYLLHCTFEPNVSIPQLANLLVERTQSNSWVVVFKSLITVHHLMCYGNERFTQYLASSNSNFQLGNFLDKSGGYDMSTYIRRYAKYLNEKAMSYRAVAFDFCKVKRGKEEGVVRSMATDKLLKTLPSLQSQVDALLEFDCSPNELSNGIINTAFMFLFRDLIRLFACYNDGIINLLEKYFEMNKKQCREGLDLYKKFLIRMDGVAEFLKVAERIGVDKGEIPDLARAPSSLLDALEQHLAQLEGRKVGTTASGGGNRAFVTSAVTSLSSTSSAFDSAGVAGALADEALKRQALAEEEAALERIKDQHQKTNPFLSSPTGGGADFGTPSAGVDATGTSNGTNGNGTAHHHPQSNTEAILDLFSSPALVQPTAVAPPPTQTGKASDDLLQLANNPFADILAASSQQPPPGLQQTTMFPQSMAPPQMSQSPMMTMNGGLHGNGFPLMSAPQPSANFARFPNSVGSSLLTSAADDCGVATVEAPPTAGDVFGGPVLQPSGGALSAGGSPRLGGATGGQAQSAGAGQPKLISNDLDMSLQSLVQNLGIGGAAAGQKQNWGSPKSGVRTGGDGWTYGQTATPGLTQMTTGMAGQQPQQTAYGAFPNQPAMGVPGGVPMQQQPPQQGAFDPFGHL